MMLLLKSTLCLKNVVPVMVGCCFTGAVFVTLYNLF